MRNLFRFLLQNHLILLFLLLETASFIFLFNFNNFQKVRFLNSSGRLIGKVYETYSRVTDYFSLPSVNRDLASENARLRTRLAAFTPGVVVPDSLTIAGEGGEARYSFIAARVVGNSVDTQHHYLTLDKGAADGVQPDMGILTAQGVAGIITNVSASYSTGLSVLNTRWNISAKIARNHYFGSLTRDGKNYPKPSFNDNPLHVDLAVGDTIVTSGYSTTFPEGILLGTIESFEKGGGENFYTIRVILSVDFRALTYVEIIDNKDKTEILSIEKLTSDEGVD